eukprot:4710480-Pyramimonas_sp.AAC.1
MQFRGGCLSKSTSNGSVKSVSPPPPPPPPPPLPPAGPEQQMLRADEMPEAAERTVGLPRG